MDDSDPDQIFKLLKVIIFLLQHNLIGYVFLI